MILAPEPSYGDENCNFTDSDCQQAHHVHQKIEGTFPIVKWQFLLVALCVVLALLCPLTIYGSTPTPIQQHDEGAVRSVLIDEVPGITINTVTLISAGWDNLVADINGEWIFRFPRLEEFIPILEREKCY